MQGICSVTSEGLRRDGSTSTVIPLLLDSFKICPMDKLEKGEEYQVQIKGELSKVTLPLYLHYILFFVSFWDFETDWHTVDFIY